jgi:hypothetical protein
LIHACSGRCGGVGPRKPSGRPVRWSRRGRRGVRQPATPRASSTRCSPPAYSRSGRRRRRRADPRRRRGTSPGRRALKRQHGTTNNWSVTSLHKLGIWENAHHHVGAGREFHFVSTIPAQVPHELSDFARRSESLDDFIENWLPNRDVREASDELSSPQRLSSAQRRGKYCGTSGPAGSGSSRSPFRAPPALTRPDQQRDPRGRDAGLKRADRTDLGERVGRPAAIGRPASPDAIPMVQIIGTSRVRAVAPPRDARPSVTGRPPARSGPAR